MKTGTKTGICIGTALLAALTAAFFPTLLYPLIALIAFMGARWGAVFMLPGLAAAIAGAILGPGMSAGSLVSAASYVCAAALITVYIKKRLPHRYALLGLALIFCLGQYLSLTLGSMLAGKAPYAETVDTWNELLTAITPVLDGASGAGFTSELFGDVAHLIPDLLMWFCILTAEGSAFGCVMLIKLYHRLFKETPAPMARFAEWRLPANALWGCLIMLAGIPAAYLLKLEQANSIAYSAGLIVASLFSVQGMAYLNFVFTVSRAPGFVKVLSWILPVFAFPYSIGLLAFIGIKEQLTQKRVQVKAALKELARQRRQYDRADELAKYGYVRTEKPEDGEKDSSGGGSSGNDNDTEREE